MQDKLQPCICPVCQVWDNQLKNTSSFINLLDDIVKNEKINKKDNQMKDNKTPAEQDYIDTAGVFWLVWCPMHNVPLKNFALISDAQKEAERLAKEFEGKHFYVLKTVSKVNVEFQLHRTNFE